MRPGPGNEARGEGHSSPASHLGLLWTTSAEFLMAGMNWGREGHVRAGAAQMSPQPLLGASSSI